MIQTPSDDDLAILRQTVRRFVREEMIPLERTIPEAEDIPLDLRARLQAKAKELGLWALDVPQQFGGAGLGCVANCVVHEEAAKTALVPFRAPSVFGPRVGSVLLECQGA